MRLGLFGGSFDPVHYGHLLLAECCREQCRLDRVWFLPAAVPPHKQDRQLSDAQVRIDMLELAVAGHEAFGVSRYEIDRGGVSYTIDTLTELRQRHGADVEMTWVIGSDMVPELPGWHRAGELLEMARIQIVARSPWDQRMSEILERLIGPLSPDQVQRLAGCVVAGPRVDISSSQVRRRMAEGKSVRFLTPEAVGAYLAEFGIYGEGGRKSEKTPNRA